MPTALLDPPPWLDRRRRTARCWQSSSVKGTARYNSWLQTSRISVTAKLKIFLRLLGVDVRRLSTLATGGHVPYDPHPRMVDKACGLPVEPATATRRVSINLQERPDDGPSGSSMRNAVGTTDVADTTISEILEKNPDCTASEPTSMAGPTRHDAGANARRGLERRSRPRHLGQETSPSGCWTCA